jgi:hypothetical protein
MDKLKLFKAVRMAIMWKEGFITEGLHEKTSRLFSVIFGVYVPVNECKELEKQSIKEYNDHVLKVLG